MTRRRKIGFRAGGFAALMGVVVGVAACGGSSSSNTTTASASPSTTASSGSAPGIAIHTAKGPMGIYLTGSSGRAIYLFVADTGDKSACSGACASLWPPVTTSGTPSGAGGALASDLGTITRSDGTKQVTYKGHPLYYYAPDTTAGQTTGQGSTQFGAKWWLVAPSGSAITVVHTASSGSSSASSSGSSTSTSSGGGWG